MELRNLTLQLIEDIFWKAMQNGWGNKNAKKQTNPLLPGYKCIAYESDKFYVLDTYCVNPFNDKSAGTMTIFFDNVPVWVMQYGGAYPKRVIPFLKLALLTSTEMRDFVGGRGPRSFVHKDYPQLSYANVVPREMNKFENFQGTECICENGYNVGQHYYRGMAFI